jgi:hypothetical protein
MPSLYFPDQYLNDLRAFNQGMEVPEHGPFWKLCGMTAGNLFEPEKVKHFGSPSDFLCCLYFLNLLNQGIYTYYRERHSDWLNICAPFVDILGCSYGHGGWTHSPDSILRFARNPSYIPRAQPVEITSEQLRSYTQFFFFEYLESIFATQHQQLFNSGELLKQLQVDADTRT